MYHTQHCEHLYALNNNFIKHRLSCTVNNNNIDYVNLTWWNRPIIGWNIYTWLNSSMDLPSVSVCRLMWSKNLVVLEKRLPQVGQATTFSWVWLFTWSFSLCLLFATMLQPTTRVCPWFEFPLYHHCNHTATDHTVSIYLCLSQRGGKESQILHSGN